MIRRLIVAKQSPQQWPGGTLISWLSQLVGLLGVGKPFSCLLHCQVLCELWLRSPTGLEGG